MVAPLTRLPDWQVRLQAWLQSAGRAPLQPGQFDCCLFAAGAIEAMTGVDLAAPFRGRYTTLRGGLRVLRRAGWHDHVALIAHHLPEGDRISATPGDVAVVAGDDGRPAAGIVQGSVIYVLATGGGLGLAPMSALQRLFRVG